MIFQFRPLLISLVCLAGVVPSTAIADEPWTASWIGANATKDYQSGNQVSNQWTCFRTEIDLEKALTSAIARIAADSKYWLWINGELAVFEGQLKRGLPVPTRR